MIVSTFIRERVDLFFYFIASLSTTDVVMTIYTSQCNWKFTFLFLSTKWIGLFVILDENFVNSYSHNICNICHNLSFFNVIMFSPVNTTFVF